LIDEISLTQEQLSQRVGKKRSTIANYMRLLKLDPIVQTGIRDGFLSMGHGRALINVDDRENQLDLYQKIIRYYLLFNYVLSPCSITVSSQECIIKIKYS